MEIFRDINEVQLWSNNIRLSGRSLGFVPTMGALHNGHAELIGRASAENDFTAVSIFVNPTQFGPGEDYKFYPKTFEEDGKLCENAGVDMIFLPEADEMYLNEHSTTVSVGGITQTMCAKDRPGHFEGVATVVCKLFNIVIPHKAYFGQKDYQQYRVIEQMVRDLNFNVELVMCPTVRERNGLAVSSRNRYLSDEQIETASNIYKALKEGEAMIMRGIKEAEEINRRISNFITGNISGAEIDYAGVYDAYSLKPVSFVNSDVVIATAVRMGKARLIDNILIKAD